MNICIKEISAYDDLLYSGLCLPTLGTYHVHNCQTRDGFILAAYIEERIVGIAVVEFSPQPRLTYVFAEAESRGHNVGTQLVKEALAYAQIKNAEEVGACVILQNSYGDVMDHILKKAGFAVTETATVIRYANDERCGRLWSEFMDQKVNKISNVLEKRGFETLPFERASSQTFDRLKASIGREFVSHLDPFNLASNQNEHILPEYSFVTLKNGEPVAFIKVTSIDDKSLIFRQISVALKYQGSGVFLLTFAAFMEKFLSGNVYTKAAALIYDSNDKMQRLVHSFIGSLSESLKTQNFYQYKLKKI